MTANRSPVIIPVFLPHAGCPHQCVFCNQRAVTGTDMAVGTRKAVLQAMETFLENRSSHGRSSGQTVQIAFYGGNFLGLPPRSIKHLLEAASRFIQAGHIDNIRFSTRPDTITSENIALINQYPVKTVEIGAQSMSDTVLGFTRRGHRAADTASAVSLLKQNGFETGVQMMVGLPGDDKKTMLATGAAIAELAPAFVRIYPTVVLAGSPLERWFTQGHYRPLALGQAVDITKQLWSLFTQKSIPVIRMGLQASLDLDCEATMLAGPYHPAFGHMVYEALIFDAVCESAAQYPLPESIDIRVHPRNLSQLNGLGRGNRKRLMDYFHPCPVHLATDSEVALDEMLVNGRPSFLYGQRFRAALDGASA